MKNIADVIAASCHDIWLCLCDAIVAVRLVAFYPCDTFAIALFEFEPGHNAPQPPVGQATLSGETR